MRNLWQRAPLWRLSIYGTAICTVLTLIFPAEWLRPHLPWSTGPVANTQASPPPALQEASSHVKPLQQSEGIVDGFAFSGHVIPLPAGVWYPLLKGQVGYQGSETVSSFVRIDQHIVTGVIMIGTMGHQITQTALDDSFALRDGTGNYTAHATEKATIDTARECWFLAPSRTSFRAETQDFPSIIRSQLDALNLPYPSLFVRAQWIYASQGESGFFYPTVITIYLSPAEAGTLRLLAPKNSWNVRSFASDPAARQFVTQTEKWFRNWVVLLRSALQHDEAGGKRPQRSDAQDPAAPLQ